MNKMKYIVVLVAMLCGIDAAAQINSVTYGRNKVQHKKFTWKYYQTENFNIYYTAKTKYLVSGNNDDVNDKTRSDNNEAIAKFVAQIAEKELPNLELNIESGLQRRANIIVYNSYVDYKQSNIGQGTEWQIPGTTTQMVNNKAAIYFNSDHENLRFQTKEAIARILVDNIMFGDNLGEIASNQALLDLPKWMVDGYVRYQAENWSTSLDDELKSAMLSGEYRTFYQFAFNKPMLAGHSFWRYIEDNYKKDNVTQFFYLTRLYKSLNTASEKVCKKKFNVLLKEFMQKEAEKYYEDISRRKNTPRGKLFTMEEVGKKDLFKFQANPAPRSQDYAVIEYNKGVMKVYLVEGWVDRKLILKVGVRTNYDEYNSQYPILAWDPKGTRLAVLYDHEGKLKLFVYDVVRKAKISKTTFPSFDQVQDMTYYLRSNALLFSGVRNGQSDLFSYNIDKFKLEQLTNDIYDDVDPNFVTFPSKTGIIFSSNRPSPSALSNDTTLPGNPFNVYLIDDWSKPGFKTYTQMSNVQFGNARYPAQYNENHYTFINDEKGVTNRYAGFFNSKAAGLDTLVHIANVALRNPSQKEIDSTLKYCKQSAVDSTSIFRVTDDSTYTFPITNYESSVLETRMNGDRDNLSETRREGNYKLLYKLRVDETKLKRRNVNIKPTVYMEKVYLADRIKKGEALNKDGKFITDTVRKESNELFQTDFVEDTTIKGKVMEVVEEAPMETILQKAKNFNYEFKFNLDDLMTGFNNNVLVNRYRPYTGGYFSGSTNSVNPNPFNAMTKFGVSDLMEDIRFTGAYRTPTNFDETEWLFNYTNFRRRIDWGATVYRTTSKGSFGIGSGGASLSGKLKSNLYQFNIAYPFAETKALKANVGLRFDRYVINAQPNPGTIAPGGSGTGGVINQPPYLYSLLDDIFEKTVLAHIEYVQDYTLNPSQNVRKGLRWKAYLDGITRVDKNINGKFTYNLGVDARHYLPIYRHITWATRAAADFSWGNQKIVYYLGGVDQNLQLGGNQRGNGTYRYFNQANKPADDQTYTYEAFAQNLRGFIMNTANGNNVMVLNSEIRIPIWSTFFSRPINNAVVRNLQLVQFFDLGTAWNGKYNQFKRPFVNYTTPASPVNVQVKVGGIGPFAGGYGFGARTMIAGYFLKFDAGWQMNNFFKQKPVFQFSTGFDF
jgi:hypothetical protein